MKRYIVTRMCKCKDWIEVEADSEEDAINRVVNGEGECSGNFEFVEELPTNTWEVEEFLYGLEV